jgi:hypothetical protein
MVITINDKIPYSKVPSVMMNDKDIIFYEDDSGYTYDGELIYIYQNDKLHSIYEILKKLLDLKEVQLTKENIVIYEKLETSIQKKIYLLLISNESINVKDIVEYLKINGILPDKNESWRYFDAYDND